MNEEVISFGKHGSLVGIITDPSEYNINRTGIILLNSGLIHRVGPNRIYVKIARKLARMGLVAFRFDFSGIGDSKFRYDNTPFEKSSIIETQDAMSYLSEVRGIGRFILIGNCSGALFSFKTACSDPRVIGAVLINSSSNVYYTQINSYIRIRALARHYMRILTQSSFRSKNLLKLFSGKGDYNKIIKVIKNFRFRKVFAYKKSEASGNKNFLAGVRLLKERGTRVFLIHSEGDIGLDYLNMIPKEKLNQWRDNGALKIEIIKGTNHSFTLLWSQDHLIRVVQNWAKEMLYV